MKYARWIGVVILIFVMGYLSAIGLFADSSATVTVGLIVIFLVGCAGVGALIPTRWQLSALCSWGAVLLAALELAFAIGRDEPIPGRQPASQVILIGLGAIGLALLGGYLGSRLRKR